MNVCLSGGADGSDLMWGDTAAKMNHNVVHLSFVGHRSKANESQIFTLTENELLSADEHCLEANKILKRKFPPKSLFSQNLLRRNWHQVSTADSIYGIGTFDKGMKIKGGTAWAFTMFMQKYKVMYDPINHFDTCEAYFFDQENCYWYKRQDGQWTKIYEPPTPSGIWAGIGTRDLNQLGKLAIWICLGYDPTKLIVV